MWPFYAAFSMVLMLISIPLAPLLVLIAGNNDRLPGFLNWFQTQDADLDGDEGWWDVESHPVIISLPRYLRRVLWLWRNPSDGFDYRVAARLSFIEKYKVYGNPEIRNRPYPGRGGWCFAVAGKWWMFYLVMPYGSSGRCLRIYLGWKLMGFINHKENPEDTKDKSYGLFPLVCAINPVRGFSVKP